MHGLQLSADVSAVAEACCPISQMLALSGPPAGVDLAKILALIVVGMPVTLLVTAQVAILIRRFSETELEPTNPIPPTPAFSRLHHIAWAAIWVVSLAGVALSPSAQVCQPSKPAPQRDVAGHANRPRQSLVRRKPWQAECLQISLRNPSVISCIALAAGTKVCGPDKK